MNLFLRAGCARLCDRLILVKAFQRYLKCVSLTFEATVCFKRTLANPFFEWFEVVSRSDLKRSRSFEFKAVNGGELMR